MTLKKETEQVRILTDALCYAYKHLESLEMCLSCKHRGIKCPEFTDEEFDAVRPCPAHEHIDSLDAENITDTLKMLDSVLQDSPTEHEVEE